MSERTFAYRIYLLPRDIVEPPISFIDSNSKWPSMSLEMLFSKLCDRYTLLVISNRIPKSSLSLASGYPLV
jgi:hypothetical protein